MHLIMRLADESLERVRGLGHQLATAQGDKEVAKGFQEELSLVLGQLTGEGKPETLEVNLETGDVFRVEKEKPKKKGKAKK